MKKFFFPGILFLTGILAAAPAANDLPTKESTVREEIPEIKQYRQLWAERTRGVNLALGKKVSFSLKPDYRLTAIGNSDETDLTDGIIGNRKHDQIWFDSGTVGWGFSSGASNGVNLLIDLGEEKPVGKAVIRVLGGMEQHPLVLPAHLAVYVSKDGKKFYKASTLTKLSPGEAEQSDSVHSFFLPETGRSFVYPFELAVHADARYIGLSIKGQSHAVFLDELAVMQAETKDGSFNTVYQAAPEKFNMDNLEISHRLGVLAVSSNIITPNRFIIKDMRPIRNSGNLQVEFDLPQGIELIGAKGEDAAGGRKIFKISMANAMETSSLYFKVTGDFPGGKQWAKLRCSSGEWVSDTETLPVQIVHIPEVKRFDALNISLVWMGEGTALGYPDFFNAWSKLGFNGVGTYPRRWRSEKLRMEARQFIDEARGHGYNILMISPIYSYMGGNDAPGQQSEIFSVFSGERKSKALCPSYRGEFYRKEIDNLVDDVEKSRPDYVFLDIECWYNGAKEAPFCLRCLEGQKKSGLTMPEFLNRCGTENIRDAVLAVRNNYKGKQPQFGIYGARPEEKFYVGIYDFNQFYPEYVQFTQPARYVGGNALATRNTVIVNRKLLGNNKQVPWITPGTYGKYPPHRLEFQIIETLMNGAGGFCYFHFGDFDSPLVFFYHAKALELLRPYENLLENGEFLFELECDNPAVSVTGVRHGNTMLLSAGNYREGKEETTITLPEGKIRQIEDIRDNGEFQASGSRLSFRAPKDNLRLFKIVFEK